MLSFSPRDVLDEIVDLIEPVSGGGEGGGVLPTIGPLSHAERLCLVPIDLDCCHKNG